MHTLSTRDLTALAYERGEEFDPALTPSPALVAELSLGQVAARPIEAPGPYERRRRRRRERRQAQAGVPEWFSAEDLFERPLGVVHGELV
ncbi:MAG: hypothetical protein M3433_03195 [Actinomycetota bacterium]|nr:hypothetical protein [Actinomycetota bacterium]